MMKYILLAILLFISSEYFSQESRILKNLSVDFYQLNDCEKIDFALNFINQKAIGLKIVDEMAMYFTKSTSINPSFNLDSRLGIYDGEMDVFNRDLYKWKRYYACEK